MFLAIIEYNYSDNRGVIPIPATSLEEAVRYMEARFNDPDDLRACMNNGSSCKVYTISESVKIDFARIQKEVALSEETKAEAAERVEYERLRKKFGK